MYICDKNQTYIMHDTVYRWTIAKDIKVIATLKTPLNDGVCLRLTVKPSRDETTKVVIIEVNILTPLVVLTILLQG